MALTGKPFSALAAAALLLLSNNRAGVVDAFSGICASTSPRRWAVATDLAMGSGAGGIDAYAAQMAAMAAGGASVQPPPAPTAPSVDEVAAEMLDSSRTQSSATITNSLTSPASPGASVGSGHGMDDVDAASAIAALEASQTLTVANIASSIPDLTLKPDASHSPSTSDFTVAGHPVKLDASDAPGPANVAWLSDLCIDSTLSSLTIYNGPLSDVPHLISRCAVTDDALNFFLDFRPRAYGAYDLRDADGNYPGPEALGRQAFEYSGSRRDFDTKFGTEDVVDFFGDIMDKFEGAAKNPGLGDEELPELEKLTRGPMAIDVTMPLSANNVETIVSAREKAASLWLEWAKDPSHAHRPGAPINSQYVYDSKYKINAYGVLLDVYVKLFGQSEGESLAAADSGPIDEAYVGGGS
eukprot:CAMPEP_0172552688 /NCGR_PEP_ID=MMETSP1067-20121228/46894_1 /TAXON_ID=265564 ORGANISM="Thalassiosira punctigera, Strain Tpunct2005C2" /NCGR_SAMPLE_ID=MMETSP1067 /ASSEMBLY_ACC=CAM_ASM_000444 /LENGTH=411 /DNA_ID=CAMNT_0013340731 /DNA_START=79 /DNA_END=1317 /DNA_ORIENTATION=+